jgi:hypothetical protein
MKFCEIIFIMVWLAGIGSFQVDGLVTPTLRIFSGRSVESNTPLSQTMMSGGDQEKTSNDILMQSRRQALVGMTGFATLALLLPAVQPAQARYVLDDETGNYVEMEEADWQTTWKQRLDKAQSMSTDDVFAAARGAGNVNLNDGVESDASKKRRAMSACRDAGSRQKAQAGSEKECTARVFGGEVDFLLDGL